MRYGIAIALDARWMLLADEDFHTLPDAVLAAALLAEVEGGRYAVVDHELRDAVAFVRLGEDGAAEVGYNAAYIDGNPLLAAEN